ncbi:MAG: YaeQ family protein [Kangiellaceae bacterium]|nr:YaeQ family protein [Kangiellaceae bacterium]
MALKATIYKATINIADMDRGYYDDLNLTIAQHPSETDRRMMVRIVAFILNAKEGLEFTKGLCAEDEPEIWQVSYSDEIELWIDLGLPDEKRIKQACHKAKKVFLYTYGNNAKNMWWKAIKNKVERFDNLSILHFPDEQVDNLEQMAARTMQLQATIQDGQLWLNDGNQTISIQLDQP